ncbi:MAG: hypothetical protein HY823_07005 [Acidobacteria bacterium]|nr:hypothetical protein [Acidobacteriota bacterium]
MAWFRRDDKQEKEVLELLQTVGRLNQENQTLKGELEELRELVGHQDSDLALLIQAASRFRRRTPPKELAEGLLDLSFRPFDLASFYVALVDLKEDSLKFLLYHEGGRARNHPPRRYSDMPGLTGRAIQSGAPLYIRTTQEGQEHGAIFTEAEKLSGLVPSTWYGIPFGLDGGPLGLVSFQSFHEDAFGPSRRKIMDALVALFHLALELR